MTGRFLSVAEVAKSLGCDQRAVLSWIHTCELEAVNTARRPLGKPRWKIPVEAWEAFKLARSNRATIVPASTPRRRRRREQGDTIQFYPEQ